MPPESALTTGHVDCGAKPSKSLLCPGTTSVVLLWATSVRRGETVTPVSHVERAGAHGSEVPPGSSTTPGSKDKWGECSSPV